MVNAWNTCASATVALLVLGASASVSVDTAGSNGTQMRTIVEAIVIERNHGHDTQMISKDLIGHGHCSNPSELMKQIGTGRPEQANLTSPIRQYFQKMVPINEEAIKKKFEDFEAAEKPNQSSVMTLTPAQIAKWRNYKRSNLYEGTRYKLEGNDDFINASHMGRSDSKRTYIATQAPPADTFGDFWQMIWESKAALIVALPQLGELKQAEQYWPDRAVKSMSLTNGITVTFDSQNDIIPKMVVRRDFILTHRRHYGVGLRVAHIHYSGWPDMGLPDEASFKKLIEASTVGMPKKRPTVVHCSSGIGRTGTFLTVHQIVSLENEANLKPDTDFVLDTVRQFRMQRRGIVETKDQFLMIHKFFLNRYGY